VVAKGKKQHGAHKGGQDFKDIFSELGCMVISNLLRELKKEKKYT
jgi:hypothetical protein